MSAPKFFLLSLYFYSTCSAQQDGLPLLLPPVPGSRNCSSPQHLDQVKNNIGSSLDQTVVPELDIRESCPCSGAGLWRKIAYLDMSDSSQQCPPNWRLLTTPVRACGAAADSICTSAVFPSNGESYSRVCGRVIGIQKGSPDAFYPSLEGRNPGLEGNYIEGVSLTHGPAGSRQHIWSFAAALWENDPNSYLSHLHFVCPCTNTDFTWPYQLPTFIGNNYFCDTGNPGPSFSLTEVYPDDPLWDGAGCGPTNACCQFRNPPWFCATLPQATTDDIELRICNDQALDDEETLVELVDIHVM